MTSRLRLPQEHAHGPATDGAPRAAGPRLQPMKPSMTPSLSLRAIALGTGIALLAGCATAPSPSIRRSAQLPADAGVAADPDAPVVRSQILLDDEDRPRPQIRRGTGTVINRGAAAAPAPTLGGGTTGQAGAIRLGIARALVLSGATMRNIRQNLVLAFVYNALGVPVAAGLFYPLFGWTLSPIIAAAAMALSSVCVVGNALRLRTAG